MSRWGRLQVEDVNARRCWKAEMHLSSLLVALAPRQGWLRLKKLGTHQHCQRLAAHSSYGLSITIPERDTLPHTPRKTASGQTLLLPNPTPPAIPINAVPVGALSPSSLSSPTAGTSTPRCARAGPPPRSQAHSSQGANRNTSSHLTLRLSTPPRLFPSKDGRQPTRLLRHPTQIAHHGSKSKRRALPNRRPH